MKYNLRRLLNCLCSDYQRYVGRSKLSREDNGFGCFRYDVAGEGHSVSIGKWTSAERCTIMIRGRNNRLNIGERVKFGPECSIWMEGENLEVEIGSGSTFTLRCHINAQEHDNRIVIGEDCMFSNNIIVRTSDSHPIYDLDGDRRLNPARSIRIGDHVWIAPKSIIMKGSDIGSGSIVGSDTMTSRAYPENVLIVGHPGRVVKERIRWTREALW